MTEAREIGEQIEKAEQKKMLWADLETISGS